jgi:hypothetical protein
MMFLRRFALAVWTMVFLTHIGMYGQQTWNAVRPFITDDARVVGGGLSQIESWMRFDDETAELWVMAATGLTPELELSIGGVSGVARHADGHSFTFALPLIQGKYLFRPYGPGEWPGIAIAAGTFLPWGSGDLVPPGYGTFAFATFTQCFGEQEDVLIHLNVGANVLNDRTINKTEVLRTWGLGTQIRTLGGFHLVGEIFSGDPYVPGSSTSWQVGFRHIFSDDLQIDGTVGKGIDGTPALPLWMSTGVRIVW